VTYPAYPDTSVTVWTARDTGDTDFDDIPGDDADIEFWASRERLNLAEHRNRAKISRSRLDDKQVQGAAMKPMTARHKPRPRNPAANSQTVPGVIKQAKPVTQEVTGFLCRDCGETVSTNLLSCPKCKGEKFEAIYGRTVLV